MIKDTKMTLKNHKGVFHFPYTMIRNKKIYYDTRIYPSNGEKERSRRLKQMARKGGTDEL